MPKNLRKFFSQPRNLLLIILCLAVFLRLFRIETFLGFGHDEDLASWIVKDVVADHHLRLIGQETSINGLFIGPIFYYFLMPFYMLFNMDPIGAVIPVTLVAVLTTLSIYLCFSKFFSSKVGLFGSLLYGGSIGFVLLDPP